MKKHFCLLAAICIVASPDTVNSQKLISNSSITGVCYAGNKTNRIYIPPPEIFSGKSGSEGGASITVQYSGFPFSSKAAVEYAVSILESVLPSGTKITLSASWERIAATGVLANSSITGYAEGWSIDALDPLNAYPVALAEKIAGKNLNDSLAPDITLRINNAVNWYLGTDGNTPRLQYDLVTIILHEVCHGLGFFDSMDTDNSVGWYGIGSLPLVYDAFLENFQGDRLTDTLTFKNFSGSLRRELTGGNLYFNGPLLKTCTSGSRAAIYAPLVWDSGSSISHLDENKTPEPNTLMTPFIDMGEAIHNPGKLTLSILGDLGWINTRIMHQPTHDTEEHLNGILLSAKIVSDTAYNHSTVGVVFSFDNFVTRDTLIMTSPGSDDIYNCTIGIPDYNTGVQYYFYAEDYFGRIYRSPSLTDSLRYSVYVGTDTVRPVIDHQPLTSFLEKIDTINLSATITDNLGMDTVYTEYRLNDGPAVFVGLKAGPENGYLGVINARELLLEGGDSIRYRLFARDSARVSNIAVMPQSGYFAVHIEGLGTTVENYSTNFTGEAAGDFINNGFDVSRPDGFSGYGLNTRHPYESPEDNNKSIEYTSIFRHPVKFRESGLLISFREVVLAEPGETGSLFGSDRFYDYVIVEGSGNFGKSWFRLTDGYDSRFFKPWETAYNGSTDGMNSTAAGSESLLNQHNIYYPPGRNIAAGDTLLIRFRLFSDPFANGWGWIIEDLKINPLVDEVEKVSNEGSVKIYPNPGNGLFRVSTDAGVNPAGRPVNYCIYNSNGIFISRGNLRGDIENVIDISDRPAGMYIIVLNRDDWIQTIKYSLIK